MQEGYPVYERFHSWQGEGTHLGKSAFFIRLHGCPVHCPWCDSAGTWHPDHKPENVERMNPDDLADEAFMACPEIVVIRVESLHSQPTGTCLPVKKQKPAGASRDLRCLPCERRD